jgi:hypothetical protein
MTSPLRKLFSSTDGSLSEFEIFLDKICDESPDPLDLGGSLTSVVPKRCVKRKKFITVDYYWVGNDLVWYIAPHPKKPWKVDGPTLALVVAQAMQKSFPKNTRVDIMRPVAGYVPEWGFRAYGVKNHWTFDESKLDESIEELLVELNTIV